jgi:hypothetical protein
MADDLLQRILGEVRERKEAAWEAFEESRRLEAALEALGPGTSGRGSDPRPAGQEEDMPDLTTPTDTPDEGGTDPGRTAEEANAPTEGTPEDLQPGGAPGLDPEDGADAGDDARETSP